MNIFISIPTAEQKVCVIFCSPSSGRRNVQKAQISHVASQ